MNHLKTIQTIRRTTFFTICTTTIATISLLLNGCEKSSPSTPNTEIPTQPVTNPVKTETPAVSITTALAEARKLPIVLNTTGTVVSLNTLDVRSQMNSVINKVHIQEGQFVKTGQLLFTLDSRLDDANVAKAQAQLSKDQAVAADAARQLARNKQLMAQNFISSSVVDTSQAAVDTQIAVLAADQSAINAAKVPLSYAKITAPSSGRIGTINVFSGSSIQAGTTALTTITQLDPIAVSFNLPQNHLPEILNALENKATVNFKLANNKNIYQGNLYFVDNSIDSSSGTIKIKAQVKNTAGKLWPGSFVDVELPLNNSNKSSENPDNTNIVIPQDSIIQTARGAMVYIIVDGKAVAKPVELLNAYGGNAAVTGLKAGDKVVLDGRQNLRVGVPVIERNDKNIGSTSVNMNVNINDTNKAANNDSNHHKHSKKTP